jgi:hypothetical protein
VLSDSPIISRLLTSSLRIANASTPNQQSHAKQGFS